MDSDLLRHDLVPIWLACSTDHIAILPDISASRDAPTFGDASLHSECAFLDRKPNFMQYGEEIDCDSAYKRVIDMGLTRVHVQSW
jgi:hypothetical protein